MRKSSRAAKNPPNETPRPGDAALEKAGKPRKKNSGKTYRAQAAWKARHPLATWAHAALRSALRRGLIFRPEACECCGATGPVEAHHPDHRDPLRVIWLTRACHKRLHAAERMTSQ